MVRPTGWLKLGPASLPGRRRRFAAHSTRDWLGLWRNGMTDGESDPPPAATAVLADAPSADSPGQALDCHDGQGRNMFYGDGHVDFLPCSAPCDASETLLSGGDAASGPRVTVPIKFVGWH